MERPARRRTGLKKIFSRPNRQKIWRKLFGEAYDAQRIGRFRLSGEIHQQMYDQFSLARLFRRVGLTDIQRRAADESGLAGWSQHHLDTDQDGKVYKPESIFMEGMRPWDRLLACQKKHGQARSLSHGCHYLPATAE